MNPQAFVSQALTLDGTPGGASAIIGDYSAVPATFFYTVPANSILHLARMLIVVRDNGAMAWTGYGAGVALANGVIIRAKDPAGNVIITSAPFRSNADWARVSFDAKILSDGPGDQLLSVAWSFFLAGSALELQPGSRVECVASDNLTGLLDQRIAVNGELK